jgi:hypothetical protein
MSFPATPLFAATLGALAVATLFALHHLRVRLVRRKVVTTMFWRRTASQAIARSWWGQFRYPWTFALLSVIALLLAASLCLDHFRADPTARGALVIDAGQSMSRLDSSGHRLLDQAIDHARADLSGVDSGVTVVVADPVPRVIARADQPIAIALRELAEISPAAVPADAAAALRLAGNLAPANGGQIIWCTDSQHLPSLPKSVAERVHIDAVGAADDEARIIGVTYEPAADAGPGRLRVRVAAFGAIHQPVALTASHEQVSAHVQLSMSGGQADAIVENVPADGSTWQLTLAGATPATGVSFQTPRTPPLRFVMASNIPRPLRTALLAIGSESAAGDRNALIVTSDGTDSGAAPRVKWISEGSPLAAGTPLRIDGGLADVIDLESSVAGNGPAVSVTHATPLISAGTLSVAAYSQDRRMLYLSTALWTGNDLPRRAAFVLLLRQYCRQLAGASDASAVVSGARAVVDPLWAAGDGTVAPAVVFERPESVAGGITSTGAGSNEIFARGGAGPRAFEMALGAALMLAVVEGLLFAARKVV